MTPCKVVPILYLYHVRSLIKNPKFHPAYWSARNVTTVSRISASLLSESSNPGVSMKRTVRPSSWKSGATPTFCVPEVMSSETSKFDPLTRFINWETVWDQLQTHSVQIVLPTVDFPLPVVPITLNNSNHQISWDSGQGVRDITYAIEITS